MYRPYYVSSLNKAFEQQYSGSSAGMYTNYSGLSACHKFVKPIAIVDCIDGRTCTIKLSINN